MARAKKETGAKSGIEPGAESKELPKLAEGVFDTGQRDLTGRKVVHFPKRVKETVSDYHDRADRSGVGKRFLASGRITALRVLRDVESGSYDCELVLLNESDRKVIAVGREEAEESEEMGETTMMEHRRLQMEVKQAAQAQPGDEIEEPNLEKL